MKEKKVGAACRRALMSLQGILITRWSIVALLAVLPVIVMPGFGDPFGSIKQSLLLILVALAFLGWCSHVYKARAWAYKSAWMLWLPVALLVAVGVSAILSSSGFASWIGAGGQGFTAFLPTMALIFVFGMVLYEGEKKGIVRRYTFAAMLGVLLALIVSLLAFFGVDVVGKTSFVGYATTGTFESVTILGAVMSLLAVSIWAARDAKGDTWLPNKKWRVAYGIVGIATLAITALLVIAADTWPTQVVLLVGSGVLVAAGLFDPKKFAKPARMLAPMAVFAVALILLVVQLSFASDKLPVEAHIGYGASTDIAVEVLKADGVFGSGPGTYAYDYTRFRPAESNESMFWDVRFDRAPSHFLTLAATWGLIPLVVLVAFLIYVVVRMVDALVLKKDREDWQTVAVLSSSWLALLAGNIVYSSDLATELVFWVITGLLLAHFVRRKKVVQVAGHGRGALLLSLVFVLAGVGLVFSLVTSAQWVIGEASMAKAISLQEKEAPVVEVVSAVQGAAAVNRWHTGYLRTAAMANLGLIDDLASGDLTENSELILQAANRAVIYAERAAYLDSMDVRNLNVLGTVHETVATIRIDSLPHAVDAYREAAKLDPVNSLQHIKLAQVLMGASDRAEAAEGAESETAAVLLAEAEAHVQTAIDLRLTSSNLYIRALVWERQGRLGEAIGQLEALVAAAPRDPVLRFELGVLQLRAGSKKLARTAFEDALVLAPTYANAKWYLAALYEEAGELDAAIQQLEDLLVMNPDDTRVQERVELMRNELVVPALEELEPLEE